MFAPGRLRADTRLESDLAGLARSASWVSAALGALCWILLLPMQPEPCGAFVLNFGDGEAAVPVRRCIFIDVVPEAGGAGFRIGGTRYSLPEVREHLTLASEMRRPVDFELLVRMHEGAPPIGPISSGYRGLLESLAGMCRGAESL